MKKVQIDNEVLKGIKSGKIVQIILNENFEKQDLIILNDDIQIEITDKSIYKDIAECFKIIPMDLFGIDSSSETKEIYKNYDKIYAYRIKYDTDDVEEILDGELLKLIDTTSIVKNNIGHSNTNVYEVKLKDNRSAILKIQKLSNRNNLYDEYIRIKWLQNKCRVPKVYYYSEVNNVKYLLMEKIIGIPAHKSDDFAFKIGKLLRELHDIDISNCSFNRNSVENLLNNALDNIDIITEQLKEKYPDMDKEATIDFLKKYMPKDRVLIHGDYSLPNIIIEDDGTIGMIDLGDLSISTKYFDFYHLRKSMIRNRKIDMFNELLKGYGIDELDENYLKWVEIVNMVLF